MHAFLTQHRLVATFLTILVLAAAALLPAGWNSAPQRKLKTRILHPGSRVKACVGHQA